MTIEIRVPEGSGGERLDRFLATQPDVDSRSTARRLIESGAVAVDGAPARPSSRLEGGEVVTLEPGAAAEPAPVAASGEIRIVHVDASLAVIDKPAGLVVHPAPSHRGPTLVELLGEVAGGGDPQRPGIVHRLDKDTSGLMVVARTDPAHRALAAAMRRRELRREYTALVEGGLESRTGTIDAPIGRDPARPTRMAVAGRAARGARTHFRVIEVLPHDTLVSVALETGRTHQIRAHFAAIAHPVSGDPRYGTPGRHGLERQFLHSTRLSLRHPDTGKDLRFESGLPADLRAALAVARAADR
jgi:23S rRNA pseudouridine1911/1915/1917 synthase